MGVICRLALAAGLMLAGTAARAGPPYATDDPEPTDLGHWEIYAFGDVDGSRGAWGGVTGLDLNYGPVEDVQLTATLPIALAHEPGLGTRSGLGDVEIGVKYRFLHQDRAGVDVAIFPRVILPTADHGLGTGRVQLLLPVWAQRDFGPWSLFGGGGYTINPGAGNRDFWQAGLALTRTVTERLSLGGEATIEGPSETGGHSVRGLAFGGIYKLDGPFSLLASGGPLAEHHGPNGWRAYAALGIAF